LGSFKTPVVPEDRKMAVDEEDNKYTIKLISADDKPFDLPRRNAMMSTLVKMTVDEAPDQKEIQIHGVKGDILQQVPFCDRIRWLLSMFLRS
jgi:hypothetical protein